MTVSLGLHNFISAIYKFERLKNELNSNLEFKTKYIGKKRRGPETKCLKSKALVTL